MPEDAIEFAKDLPHVHRMMAIAMMYWEDNMFKLYEVQLASLKRTDPKPTRPKKFFENVVMAKSIVR